MSLTTWQGGGMTTGRPGDDPGWGTPREILLGFVPGLAARRTAKAANPLAAMRSVFTSFVVALVLYGLVLSWIDLGSGSGEPPSFSSRSAIVGVVLIGLAALTASSKIGGPLRCGTPVELVGRYRTRFFLRVAFAESAALFGFVAAFLCEDRNAYFAGMAVALVGFARLAPTGAHIERDQEQLRASGCPASLHDALLGRPQL
jgi:F0F1-type ATP synthase membrane subunit c/vacuolar-type H+-ATPase subunit K